MALLTRSIHKWLNGDGSLILMVIYVKSPLRNKYTKVLVFVDKKKHTKYIQWKLYFKENRLNNKNNNDQLFHEFIFT